jgi:hypothetical protein
MARFHGVIGYGHSVEGAAGVWKDVITERSYYGDVIRNSRRLQDGQEVNSNLTVSNSISIVSDTYASENILAIRYIGWMGYLWQVSEVEVQRPRLILRLGGVYNGPVAAPVTP